MSLFTTHQNGMKRLACAIMVSGLMIIAQGTALAGPKGAVGDLYVADPNINNVTQYDRVTGVDVGIFAYVAMRGAFDLTFGPNGNLFVVNVGDGTVNEYDGSTGAFIKVFISTGLPAIMNILFTPNGTVLVGDSDSQVINEYDGSTGSFIRTFATGIKTTLGNGLIIGPNGNMFASDILNNTVREYALDGTDLGIFTSGGGLNFPVGIAFGGPDNNLFVSSHSPSSVLEYDGVTGVFIGVFSNDFGFPQGLRFGPDGNLWVGSDQKSKININEFDPVTGELILSINTGINSPYGLAFKPPSGRPLDCLSMTVSTLIAGQNATWDISGATPGSKVAIVYGFQPGSTVVSGRFDFCATFGIKDVSQSKVVGAKAADRSGDASVIKAIPASASGLTVLTQAAEQNTCPKECVSNLDTQVIQ